MVHPVHLTTRLRCLPQLSLPHWAQLTYDTRSGWLPYLWPRRTIPSSSLMSITLHKTTPATPVLPRQRLRQPDLIRWYRICNEYLQMYMEEMICLFNYNLNRRYYSSFKAASVSFAFLRQIQKHVAWPFMLLACFTENTCVAILLVYLFATCKILNVFYGCTEWYICPSNLPHVYNSV